MELPRCLGGGGPARCPPRLLAVAGSTHSAGVLVVLRTYSGLRPLRLHVEKAVGPAASAPGLEGEVGALTLLVVLHPLR